ncbi:MAG: CHC2 zinc finger domain-containing protein, partial [Culicoidibacterales bacterium]
TLLEKTPERVIATFQKKSVNQFGFEQLSDNQIISAYEGKKIVNHYLIQDIEQKIDMKQIAEHYVVLRKTGRSYCGYSPFRSERTASFHVFPETNTWYDFGLSEGGNAISFIRKQHDFSFSQAVACLYQWSKQQQYQRTLQIKAEPIVQKYTKAELHAVLEFYQKVTQIDDVKLPEPMKLYLAKRRITSETAKVFNISYVDQEVSVQIHRNDGAIIEQLAEAGVLFRKSDGRIAFKMENRVAIPLHDEFGSVIGYNGRVYDEQRQPKYLLTNTTSLFQKSSMLFNYHRAQHSAKERGNLIVTEGVFDVMRCHQQGFPQAVALLGSSLSTKQLELIKQLAVPVVLALDHDSAGEKATQRIGEQLAQAQITYDVFPLPIGQDLDQALQQSQVQQDLLTTATRRKSEST